MSVPLLQPLSERDHVLGPADAPITLVEYGDFECPFCGQAYPAVKEVQQQLGSRLRFAFRHFPRTIEHPHSHLAAEAAEAAGAQGQFWPMHDLIFEHQSALEIDDLTGYAAQLPLDAERFRRELETHVYRDRVQADVHTGIHADVHGTPTFFINGVRHDGRWGADELVEAIEAIERARRSANLAPSPEVAEDEVDEAS